MDQGEVLAYVYSNSQNLMTTRSDVCKSPSVKLLGSQKSHWDGIEKLIEILFVDGGTRFPNGVVFSKKTGGLPAPDDAAKSAFKRVFKALGTEAGMKRILVCGDKFKDELVATFTKVFADDDGDEAIDKYLAHHCVGFTKFMKGNHCKLTVNITRALLQSVSATMKYFGNDLKLQAAAAELVFDFFDETK